MGVKAVELLINGYSGLAVGIKKNEIIYTELEKVNAIIDHKKDNYGLLDIISY